jgi:hypothetical protein
MEEWSPEVARLARAALAGGLLSERRAAAEHLADHVLAPIGGVMPIEWAMEWEELEEPGTKDEG